MNETTKSEHFHQNEQKTLAHSFQILKILQIKKKKKNPTDQ